MSAANSVPTVESLRPSETYEALEGLFNVRRAPFIWGPPGIAKSSIVELLANNHDVAFIDVRLSNMEPTDLRGIPYPVVEHGVHGIRWSAPLVMPRDLDEEHIVEVDAIERIIRFFNPKGDNEVAYCQNPQIEVKSLTVGLVAEVVSPPKKGQDRFIVRLVKPEDVGKPEAEAHAGKVRYAVTGKTTAVLILDEFNSAPPSVQAAAYQLILNFRIGEYIVPKGVFMVAAGNRETDKGVTYRMPTPILNRFVSHIEMTHDKDDWLKWAAESMIHPQVLGYITAFPEQLFQQNFASMSRGFATPRSWHAVSDILHGAAPKISNERVLRHLIIGALGYGAGAPFFAFRERAAGLPSPEAILSGQLTEIGQDTSIELAYALVTAMCHNLKHDATKMLQEVPTANQHPAYQDWLKRADRYFGFMMNNFKPDVVTMGAKLAFDRYDLPMSFREMPNMLKLAKEFRSLIQFNVS